MTTINQDELAFRAKLQRFLNTLLSNVVSDKDERFRLLSNEAMVVWSKAFTHETYSAEDNYEDLEYQGDIILKSVFPKYLLVKYPKLHRNGYTELNTEYMAKPKQSSMASSLGFPAYIRADELISNNFNLNADVFESFFGALDTVGDLIQLGLGYAYCYNMIYYLFETKGIKIDIEKYSKGSTKTNTEQIFTRFGLGKVIAEYASTEDDKTIATISLTPEQMAFLRIEKITITNPIIGRGEGKTKIVAEKKAYDQAYAFLNSLGVTPEWADWVRQVRDFTDPLISPYVNDAIEKLRSSGYEKMFFFISQKTSSNEGTIVQLRGVKPNGKTEILASVYSGSTKEDRTRIKAKAEAIKKYVGK